MPFPAAWYYYWTIYAPIYLQHGTQLLAIGLDSIGLKKMWWITMYLSLQYFDLQI